MKSLQKTASERKDAMEENMILRQKLENLKSLEEVRKGKVINVLFNCSCNNTFLMSIIFFWFIECTAFSGFVHEKNQLLESNDIEGLADKVVLLEKTLRHKREDFRALESDYKALQRSHRALKQQHDAFVSETNSAKEEVKVLETQIAQLKQELHSATSDQHSSESPAVKRLRTSTPSSIPSTPTSKKYSVTLSSTAKNFKDSTSPTNRQPFNDPVVTGFKIMQRKIGSGLLKENNSKSAIRIGYDGFGGHSKHLTTRRFSKPSNKIRPSRNLDSTPPPLPTLD